MKEMTGGVGTEQWKDKSKDMTILAYVPGASQPETISVMSNQDSSDKQDSSAKKKPTFKNRQQCL